MSDLTLIIDTLLNSRNAPVSFRHLSAHLKIPTRDAQSLLLDYVSTHPNVEVLWGVTTVSSATHRRLSLTTSPPHEYLSKTVWAIAPAGTGELWLASDSTAALALSGASVARPNALRDGRFNPIKSERSIWKATDGEASAPHQTLPSKTKPNRGSVSSRNMHGQDKPFGGSLLAEMNREQKDRGMKRAMSLKGNFKSVASNSNTRKKVNTSACKKLGAAALAKIRAANQNENNRPSVPKKVTRRPASEGSKGRRIVEEESDGGDSDVDKEQEALRREAAEQERAETERKRLEREREEAMLEAQELARDDDDEDEEPQSPNIRDLDEEPAAMEIDSKRTTSDKRTPEKRKLNEALGLPEVSRPQRTRKEVRETVPGEGGYVIERVVTKEFDQHGNEIREEKVPVGASSQKADVKEKSKGFFTSSLRNKDSLANTQNGKSQSNVRKGKDARKSSTKLGASIARKASKKKINGNIWSYFK